MGGSRKISSIGRSCFYGEPHEQVRVQISFIHFYKIISSIYTILNITSIIYCFRSDSKRLNYKHSKADPKAIKTSDIDDATNEKNYNRSHDQDTWKAGTAKI